MARRRAKRGTGWVWLLVAVILLPPLAFVGATASAVFYLRERPPPTSAYMQLARELDPAAGIPCGDEVVYEWVDRDAISPELPLAVVLAEDQRFFQHEGFDFKAIRRAVKERDKGRVRGASTLSQQLAKNLFLWPEQSYLRKGLEAWLTIWIESTWDKQRILEVYLNVVQFGPCCFGAEAASQRFFGHSAAELQPNEAALLAAVLPNPKKLRAHNPGPYAQQRTDEILQLMHEHRDTRYLRGRL